MISNETWEIILSAANILISAILTIFIIIQTNKLNYKQQKLEKEIENSQKKRELYTYRREVYRAVILVNEFANNIVFYFNTIKIENRTGTQIKEALDKMEQFNQIDSLKLRQLLLEAELVFSNEVFMHITNIRNAYINIINASSELSLYDMILTENEKQEQMHDAILTRSQTIKEKADSIIKEYDNISPNLKKEISLQPFKG